MGKAGWFLISVGLITLTVLVCAWLGRPIPLDITFKQDTSGDDLDLERIHETITHLSSGPSRLSGSPGADEAAAYIQQRLAASGISEIETDTFSVAVPQVDFATLEATTSQGRLSIPIYPLWPNLARTSQTPPSGISGALVDAGGGTDSELKGKKIQDSIVIMDWGSNLEWLNIPEFGGKAVLFRDNPQGTGYTARNKIVTVPADFPRYFVRQQHLAVLDQILADPQARVTIRCRMGWRRADARNILAHLPDTPLSGKEDDPDSAPIILHAYYDSISLVPQLSPGAEQACGVAALLELADYFATHPPVSERPVYLLFTGGHGQALAGITRFTRRLKDGLQKGWPAEDQNTLAAGMGRPGLFVGLDLSSRTDRFGWFCVGRFRGYYEHLLRPRFSMLGLKLSEYASQLSKDLDPTRELSCFVDGINLTLGRGWWTYFPYQSPFESELPVLAGMPAITLASVNDDRRYVDTPGDTPDRFDKERFKKQILYEPGRRVGLLKIVQALVNWKGPFVNAQLLDKWSRLSGRVVWLEPKTNYTPDEPLADSLVVLKSQRGDKYLMGTRGVPAVLTDDKGAYEFDGAIDITGNSLFNECLVEAYGIADDHFIQANPAAWAELERARSQRGRLPAPLEPDGSVVFAQDMARPLDFPNKVAFIKQDQSLNLVTFPCRALTLYGLTEPRGFIPLKQVVLLEAGTDSPPFQFGQSTSDSTIGLVEENCVSLWADPSMNVRITFGLGFQGKRLVLTNSSPEKPFGEGFLFDRISTIPSMVLQGARDMWNLDSLRIEKLEAHGVQNPRIRKLHEESRHYLDKAGQALESLDYLEYRSSSERGWALESKAYSELYTITNNMIRGVLFYLALLVPFAYCFERLLFAAATIRGRILGMMAVFAISFLGLVMVHPAFRFAKTPLVVLLAFLILSLAVAVIALIMGKFDRLLLQQKMMAVGIHEDSANLGGTIARAIDLGISNIRRRPQRCFLTAATIVLITFTLLSFTSLVPETSISILQHPKGEPVYRGLLARDRGWMPIPLPLYQSLKRTFGSEEGAGSEITPSTRSDLAHAGSVVAGRAWFFSDTLGNLSQIDLSPAASSQAASLPESASQPGFFTSVALLGMEPTEPRVSGIDSALVAGSWFSQEDQMGIILPLHIAKFLGYGPQDIGKGVLVYGENLPLIGLLDSAKVDKIIDIDGEPIMPVNFSLQTLMRANRTEQVVPDTLEDYVHYSSDQVAIVPLKMALRLGASFRSIGIRVGPGMDVRKEAEGYARRSNQTILASDGETVNLYASLDRSRVNAAAEIIVPVLLAFLMVLGTMLGSVYERRSEIFIYNSVGLSPTHVSMLFLAESAVYAILGASLGYLLGQIVSRLLFVSGLLEGLTLNYSAGSTVFVTGLTMFIVLLSTLFPMRQAFLAAVPETKEANPEGEEESGERLSIFLPFVTDRQSVEAMQAYMLEFLEGVQGVSVGQLAVEDLQVGALEEEGLSSPVLKFRAWLAPFDLGISHDAVLSVRFRPDRGVFQYHLTARRHSGDQQNWKRLTPRFIGSLRKQLLMWRILSRQEHSQYAERGERLFSGNVSSECG